VPDDPHDQAWRSDVEGSGVIFRLADPDGQLSGVRLWEQLGLPGETLDFARVEGGWELRLARPSVHRMEYLFAVRDADGGERTVVDPTNPARVAGAFGFHRSPRSRRRAARCRSSGPRSVTWT